jgi:hypothetical protein
MVPLTVPFARWIYIASITGITVVKISAVHLLYTFVPEGKSKHSSRLHERIYMHGFISFRALLAKPSQYILMLLVWSLISHVSDTKRIQNCLVEKKLDRIACIDSPRH